MSMPFINLTQSLLDFFDRQLHYWPEAAERYAVLRDVKMRTVNLGGFNIRLQFNPARAASASAAVDKASISARPCFLCISNRPEQQMIFAPQELSYTGMDILVNPFPIFPKHFTIVCQDHRPQDEVDLTTMAEIAFMLPGMVTFFNGSHSGASAPDHLHLQCGNIEFLPVCEILNEFPGKLMYACSEFSAYDNDILPMQAVHFLSKGFTGDLQKWLDKLVIFNEETGVPDIGMRNILMWPDSDGYLHTLFFPRKAHRPSCYFKQENEGHMMVSPGAVDMAGVLILPRECDYINMQALDIQHIYDEVSYSYRDSSQFQKLMLQ